MPLTTTIFVVVLFFFFFFSGRVSHNHSLPQIHDAAGKNNLEPLIPPPLLLHLYLSSDGNQTQDFVHVRQLYQLNLNLSWLVWTLGVRISLCSLC